MLNAEHVALDAIRALPLLGEMERAFNERIQIAMSKRIAPPTEIHQLREDFNRRLISLRMNFNALSTTRNMTFVEQIQADMKRIAEIIAILNIVK